MVNTENYKLYIAKNDIISEVSLVGSFRKKDDPDFTCEIIMNTNAVRESGFSDSCSTMFPDKAVIYVSMQMMAALRDNDNLALFNLYRELGHIELGHFEMPEGFDETDEEAQAKLMMDQEIEADAFAAEFIGKENALSALKQLLTMRAQLDRELNLNGTPSSVQQMRKYRARINAMSEA